jgi:ketosteroid isomerase-like protein
MLDEALIRDTWAALSKGDLRPVKDAFAPDARWRGVADAPGCQSRKEILTRMRRNLGRRLSGRVEEVFGEGERTIVAFRPDEAPAGEPLDDGLRYVVLTERGGLIAEMKGCADRACAIAYARR